jgi:polyphosphate glucokinase
MNVLVIDIGGTNIKMLVTGQTESRRFPSGPKMTPELMIAEIKELTKDWQYNVVSIGYPGIVKRNIIITEPHNLGPGWIRFDFDSAFGRPVRKMNDAGMQALGSYKQGIMLFLGLGTGLGSAIIAENVVLPMELAHLSYKRGTFEDYIGIRGLKKLGRRKWQANVEFAIERLIEAVHPDDIVLGGGNSKKLKPFPAGCRLGDNVFAFEGGFRMWQDVMK